MDTIISKHYHGYQGEPEIQFIRISNEGKKIILSIWIVFFDSIISLLKPKKTGWKGLAYYYHMHEGWYDESPWQITDIAATINELQEININDLDIQTQDAFNEIIKLLTNSLTKGDTAWINYD